MVQAHIRYLEENDIALILGEFFYQLRAALDATAYRSLVLQEGIDPPEKADSVEFPIYKDEDKFNRSPLIKSSLPQEVKDWLQSLQPFAFENSKDTEIRELGRRLKILHDCARKDRHRRLHVTMATITNLKTAFWHTPNLKIFDVQPIPINFLGGDTDFLSFKVVVIGDGDRHIKLATGVTIELAVEDINENVLFSMLEAAHELGYEEARVQLKHYVPAKMTVYA